MGKNKSLKDYMKEAGDLWELESLRRYPNADYIPKLSHVNKITGQIRSLINLLEDLFEVSEVGDEAFLIKKTKNHANIK